MPAGIPTTAPPRTPRPTEPAAQPTSAPTPTLAAVTPPSSAPAPAGSNDARGLPLPAAAEPRPPLLGGSVEPTPPVPLPAAAEPRPPLLGGSVEPTPLGSIAASIPNGKASL